MSKSKQEFVLVRIPCTFLVKRYLEANFGNPVRITEDHFLNKLACAQLSKRNAREDDTREFDHYIDLALGRNNFLYDGFHVSNVNARIFNKAVDKFIKESANQMLKMAMTVSEQNQVWKERLFKLMSDMEETSGLASRIRARASRYIEGGEFNIKQAIEVVVYDLLKLDFDVLSYDTVKKNFFRHRKRNLEFEQENNFSRNCPLTA